jgi:hypothetical protein
VDRIQPRRLLLALMPGTVTAVPGTGSYWVTHAGRTRRRVDCRSILEEASSCEPWGQHLSVGGGAILTFAVDVTTSGFSINTVGVILMVAGALGLVLSLLFWSSFSPYRRSRTVAGPDTVVEERRIEGDLP